MEFIKYYTTEKKHIIGNVIALNACSHAISKK